MRISKGKVREIKGATKLEVVGYRRSKIIRPIVVVALDLHPPQGCLWWFEIQGLRDNSRIVRYLDAVSVLLLVKAYELGFP